jgi:hypothetical protein
MWNNRAVLHRRDPFDANARRVHASDPDQGRGRESREAAVMIAQPIAAP